MRPSNVKEKGACTCGNGQVVKEVLAEVRKEFKGKPDELIPILQRVQRGLGYLPEEALQQIARFTGLPASRVFSVATFYAMFRLTPIGKNHVMVCRGTACHVRGAPRILEEIKKGLKIEEGETTPDMKFSLETVACIGACGLAPNMVVNGRTYGRLTKKKASDIISDIRAKEKTGQ
ncbi:MAG: NADH-quinone oxidoreductase subunit NuoE [Candidatus Lindowbacteria bacterium]|nr:NADH-quinone oxidoreductase subunit NuoE [Candidatus Lindowbacteria bacterium]